MPFSVNDVLGFFAYAEEKGLLKPNTARANKAVVARVTSVMDPAEQGRLSEFNAEEVYRRFVTKHATKLSPDSLRVYKSRFASALDSFQQWYSNPGNYVAGAARVQAEPVPNATPAIFESAVAAQRSVRPLLPEIPIPLAEGVVAKIIGLPHDLTQEEADRLKRIVDSYINC